MNAPELLFGLDLYWVAYQELTTCRPVAFGGSLPIPLTSVVEYARLYELDEEQTEDLSYVVRRLDEAFLDHERKQSKGNGGKLGHRTKNKKGR